MQCKAPLPKKKKVYDLPTGRISEDEISAPVMRVMKQSCTNVQSQRRKERRYRDDRECEDGQIECFSRDLYQQDTVADAIDALETSAKVQQALAMLSKTQQRRIHLYYYAGFNKREIADFEGVSRQNVSKSIKQALRILKKILK